MAQNHVLSQKEPWHCYWFLSLQYIDFQGIASLSLCPTNPYLKMTQILEPCVRQPPYHYIPPAAVSTIPLLLNPNSLNSFCYFYKPQQALPTLPFVCYLLLPDLNTFRFCKFPALRSCYLSTDSSLPLTHLIPPPVLCGWPASVVLLCLP